GWEGVGRRGPDFDPDAGPAHHTSGFRWSRKVRPEAPRFAWRDDLPEAPDEPPGFRWRPPQTDAPPRHPRALPEKAFDWADPAERGFRWGDRESPPEGE
ncbi:MAG: hypothetical protein RQ745_14015, partial [Longimicrobiales bacterium]|nr:hypothetical protein [Longimicrobiales bacterium]